MALADVTSPDAIRQAISEFRSLGQSAFLEKYGFGTSRGWLLVDDDGREYDAKAIAGAAHGYQYPETGPLHWQEFHGGEATARKLRDLGFKVVEPEPRNPPWTRDELILALDLYLRHRPNFPGPKHPEVVELSRLLNRLPLRSVANARFRNTNGVAMKLQNFRRFDPSESGRGLLSGGKQEAEVWRLFAGDPTRLARTAAAIRAGISELEEPGDLEVDDGEWAEEGATLTRLHRLRERNRTIVAKRKAKALQEHGILSCQACGFSFGRLYGERGQDYIECHHIKPVSELQSGEKTRLRDLALLCANCHRMVHLARPWMTVEELKGLIRAATGWC